jgi:hypothetical protein
MVRADAAVVALLRMLGADFVSCHTSERPGIRPAFLLGAPREVQPDPLDNVLAFRVGAEARYLSL